MRRNRVRLSHTGPEILQNAAMMIETPSPTSARAPGFHTSPARPLALLARCPAHAPTPLREAPGLAARLGLDQLWIKDESPRMGLGSFKALGGAFAVAQMILDRAGTDDPMDPQAQAVARDMTFITASAGNHGLSVAVGARVFGARARVVLSASVPQAFARRIEAMGAEVIRVDGSYEDSVAEAVRLAEVQGWIHLADGSWSGYTAAPALIMEGYTVLAEECRAAFATQGQWPTHVFLQAGVGRLAAAMAAHIRESWDQQPKIIVVEPEAAPCLLRSVAAGALTRGDGPVSAMGRLDCKDASLLAYQTLRHDADRFVTVTEDQAAQAVTLLAEGAALATTPSGAAGLAALLAADLPAQARALVILSEGPEG